MPIWIQSKPKVDLRVTRSPHLSSSGRGWSTRDGPRANNDPPRFGDSISVRGFYGEGQPMSAADDHLERELAEAQILDRVNTELVIARHAEAVCNMAGVVGGRRGCAGLTSRGREQAELLGNRLEREHDERPFAVILSSPLRRALETAQIIAPYLVPAPPLAVLDALRDPDPGAADGRPWSTALSGVSGTLEEGLGTPIAPGAETWEDYWRRAAPALAELVADHAGERVLVVAHGEFVTLSFMHFLQLPIESRVQAGIITDDASITRWRTGMVTPARADAPRLVWTLEHHNDTRHLGESA